MVSPPDSKTLVIIIIHNYTQILIDRGKLFLNDFPLKYCILKEDTKNNISGRNIASLTPACLRNRQVDPPQINRGYPKDCRFLFKRYRVISFSFNVDALFIRFPLKTSSHNQQKVLKKCEDSNLEVQACWTY
jgi:hypothetical protein